MNGFMKVLLGFAAAVTMVGSTGTSAKADSPIQLGAAAQAGFRNGGFGLGIVLGEPSGLSAKWWLSKKHALQFGANWNFKHDSFGFNVDYLFHFDVKTKATGFDLPLYIGIGGRGVAANEFVVAVRVPLGISMAFRKVPVDVYFELAPGISLIPAVDFEFNGGIGARYYF